MATFINRKTGYRVDVGDDGTIRTKPGDTLNKISAAICGSAGHFNEFGRRNQKGSVAAFKMDLSIQPGEVLYHIPTFYKSGKWLEEYLPHDLPINVKHFLLTLAKAGTIQPTNIPDRPLVFKDPRTHPIVVWVGKGEWPNEIDIICYAPYPEEPAWYEQRLKWNSTRARLWAKYGIEFNKVQGYYVTHEKVRPDDAAVKTREALLKEEKMKLLGLAELYEIHGGSRIAAGEVEVVAELVKSFGKTVGNLVGHHE